MALSYVPCHDYIHDTRLQVRGLQCHFVECLKPTADRGPSISSQGPSELQGILESLLVNKDHIGEEIQPATDNPSPRQITIYQTKMVESEDFMKLLQTCAVATCVCAVATCVCAVQFVCVMTLMGFRKPGPTLRRTLRMPLSYNFCHQSRNAFYLTNKRSHKILAKMTLHITMVYSFRRSDSWIAALNLLLKYNPFNSK